MRRIVYHKLAPLSTNVDVGGNVEAVMKSSEFHTIIDIPEENKDAERRQIFLNHTRKLTELLEQSPCTCVAIHTLVMHTDGSSEVFLLAPPEATLHLGLALLEATLQLPDTLKVTPEDNVNLPVV